MTATCPSTRAHWRHLANTIELVHPPAHSSPQSKRQMDRFSRFCTAYSRKCLYTLQWVPLSTRIMSLPMEDLDLPCNTSYFRPIPLPSNRHHPSNGDCLEGKGEIIRSVLCNIVCNNCAQCNMHTHMNRPISSLDWVLSHWAHLTVLRFIFYICNIVTW